MKKYIVLLLCLLIIISGCLNKAEPRLVIKGGLFNFNYDEGIGSFSVILSNVGEGEINIESVEPLVNEEFEKHTVTVTSQPYKKNWDNQNNHSIDKGILETDDEVKIEGKIEVTQELLKNHQSDLAIKLIKGVKVISKEGNEIIVEK